MKVMKMQKKRGRKRKISLSIRKKKSEYRTDHFTHIHSHCQFIDWPVQLEEKNCVPEIVCTLLVGSSLTFFSFSIHIYHDEKKNI